MEWIEFQTLQRTYRPNDEFLEWRGQSETAKVGALLEIALTGCFPEAVSHSMRMFEKCGKRVVSLYLPALYLRRRAHDMRTSSIPAIYLSATPFAKVSSGANLVPSTTRPNLFSGD